MPVDHPDEPLMGESLGDVLDSMDIREPVSPAPIKELVTMQIETALRERSVSKVEVASRMGTSRTQVNRILDPRDATVSLRSLVGMADRIGKRRKVESVGA